MRLVIAMFMVVAFGAGCTGNSAPHGAKETAQSPATSQAPSPFRCPGTPSSPSPLGQLRTEKLISLLPAAAPFPKTVTLQLGDDEVLLMKASSEFERGWKAYFSQLRLPVLKNFPPVLLGYEIVGSVEDMCWNCQPGAYSEAFRPDFALYCDAKIKSLKAGGIVVVSRGYTELVEKGALPPRLVTAVVDASFYWQFLRSQFQRLLGMSVPAGTGGGDYCVAGMSLRAIFPQWPDHNDVAEAVRFLDRYRIDNRPIGLRLAAMQDGYKSGRLEQCLGGHVWTDTTPLL